MKKTIAFMSISLLISLPVLANDLAKPPIFKPSAETIEKIEKQKIQQKIADKQHSQQKDKEVLFPDGHDPRDHDHDHDDPEDLDHEHDDPRAHEKQLEAIADKEDEGGSSWWPF